jgi:hypothetical protein
VRVRVSVRVRVGVGVGVRVGVGVGVRVDAGVGVCPRQRPRGEVTGLLPRGPGFAFGAVRTRVGS